jgi:hypothetical protein
MTFEDGEGGGEESSGGEGEEDDGSTVGSLGCGRSGGGVVEALGAALWMGWGSESEDRCEESDSAEVRRLHWKKAKRAKRKSQRIPMACQYQAAPSTMIWRVSRWREM